MTSPARFLLISVTLLVGSAVGQDWTRFRGSDGSGMADPSSSIPLNWGPKENLSWKTALPGPGVSSPIVVGKRVFVTCWSGYGVDRRNRGDLKDLKRHLVCLDRNNGKILWQRAEAAATPEDEFNGMGIPEHGYASHTPTSDGKQVFAFFGKSGVYAYDMKGNKQWQTNVGKESDQRRWGSASSPLLYKNIVIVPAIAESEALVGLDKATGKEVWRQEASGFSSTWGTPILVKVNNKRTDLVIGVPFEVWGFDPQTGKLRWYSEGAPSSSFYTSVIAQGDTVYASAGGRGGGGTVAIRAGGKGDVSKSKRLWSESHSASFGSPVICKDKIVLVSRGVLNLIAKKSGERVSQQRLTSAKDNDNSRSRQRSSGGRGGRFGSTDYSSPVSIGEHVIFVRRNGDTYVLKLADDKLETVSVNRACEEREDFSASPAISNGQLFLRSSKHLYCIAKPKSVPTSDKSDKSGNAN